MAYMADKKITVQGMRQQQSKRVLVAGVVKQLSAEHLAARRAIANKRGKR